MTLYKGTRRIKKMTLDGTNARVLIRGGREVWPCRLAYQIPTLEHRMIFDSDGYWMEVGFSSPEELTGSAAAGWTDDRGYAVLRLQSSVDLATWVVGNFEDCPGSPEDMGDGTWEYWSRLTVPVYWQSVMVDLTATTDRYGKAITGIDVMGTAVSLPNFPYDMPADAAQLQTDLRAAGYTAATVTSTSGSLTARAKNHLVTGPRQLIITQSGSNVTAVTSEGSGISLPSYPYSMPTQRATLQADLRTAGYTGAVVMLYGDSWTVTLPDRLAAGTARDFSITIDPGDPFPYWDQFGTYQGLNPAAGVQGTSGNVRTPDGDPLVEAGRQFARMKITRGTRVLP